MALSGHGAATIAVNWGITPLLLEAVRFEKSHQAQIGVWYQQVIVMPLQSN